MPTEHETKWWGNQPCRRCNPGGYSARPAEHPALCPDCDGSGWTAWAALATEPWSEVIRDLWVGGHDYNVSQGPTQEVSCGFPENRFAAVFSMYSRPGFEPTAGEHIEMLVPDGLLTPAQTARIYRLAREVANRVQSGQKVLTRCQAGLNRASLVGGLALVWLGYDGNDAVQLLRARRSPWALCNPYFEVSVREATIEGMQQVVHEDRGTRP